MTMLLHVTFVTIIQITFTTTCFAQQEKRVAANKQIFKAFCKKLNDSKIVYRPDTTAIGLGVYSRFATEYFDEAEMRNNFQKDTSYFTIRSKFFLVQQSIGVLQNYLKYLPAKDLKIIDFKKSKSLAKGWENGDKEELDMVNNSLTLLYTDSKREIELMVINFSSKQSRIVFFTSFGMSVEDSKFITEKLKHN